MTTNPTDLWIDLILRFQSLSWLDWLDFVLVAAVFFVLVSALERAQATFMLRGITVIGVTLLITAFLLPLPAFGLLARVILLSLLITVPIVFQRELRRLLENVGRSIGLATDLQLEPEEIVRPVMRAVERMAADHIGALIVLEGEINLEEIAQTGVALGSPVSAELLRAIFYPNNPLHDGAMLIRGHKIIAAGCVLPIAQRNMIGRRLGTRHRAALGLVERTDAFVIVVSEETGRISVAEGGELQRLAEPDALREHLIGFSKRNSRQSETVPKLRSWLNPSNHRPSPDLLRRIRHGMGRLGLALLFAFMLWWFVLISAGALPNLEIRDIPLLVEGQAAGLTLAQNVPPTVNLVVRSSSGSASLLDEGTFTAALSLDGLDEGVHEVPVAITSRAGIPLRVITVNPETVAIDLAAMARRPFSVTAVLTDETEIPGGYEVRDEPAVEPATVIVEGPQPLVDQVIEIRVVLSLAGIRNPVATTQPLVALDPQGNVVTGLSLYPADAVVRLDVGRRPDVRDVGVAIVTEGEPAPGFWVSGLTSQPATIILQGSPAALAAVRTSVATLPVAINGAIGDVSVDVPLDLPPETAAQDVAGVSLASVRVTVRISAVRGHLTISRPVELFGAMTAADTTITPAMVDVLLEGPVATLREIEQNPDLVRVVVQGITLPRGSSIEETVQIVAPEGIRAQPLPDRVTISRR